MTYRGLGYVATEESHLYPLVYKGRGVGDYDSAPSFPNGGERNYNGFQQQNWRRREEYVDGAGKGRGANRDTEGQWNRGCLPTAAEISPWVNKGRGSNGFNNSSTYQQQESRGRAGVHNTFGSNLNTKGRGFVQPMYEHDPWNQPSGRRDNETSSNYVGKGRGIRNNDTDFGFYSGFNALSVSSKKQYPSSTTFDRAGFGGFERQTSNFDDVDPFLDNTKTPSTKNSEFYSNFGGGFASVPVEENNEDFNYIPKDEPQGFVGFQDWKIIEKEMKEAEIRKWADLPLILKDFYTEHPDISTMTEDEADVYRLSKNNIMVEDTTKTRPVPKPVKTFEHAFKDQPEIMEEIKKQGFVEPSPIQCQMWPIALSGHDVIGIAQTGTGKTLAFLLPIFIHLESQVLPRAQREGPGALILSPTRELALQIHHEIKKFKYKGIRSICIYGGGDRRGQIKGCFEGVDIIIATPGRLNDLVCSDVIKLRSISFLVLDEADRMLDMGFEPQIKKILLDIRPDRHSVMTSATWPKEVRELGDKYTKDAYIIVIGSLDLTACHAVTQVIEIVHEEKKRERLFNFVRCLSDTEKVIVFVGKKSLADDLSSDLFRLGIKCASLHGDRDQSDREQALDDIKKGKVRVLVATDVASRGLDIVDITHVYNYDFPRHMEEYVHRVGRTGRAGRVGVSITLMTRTDWRHAAGLIKILEEATQEVPEELRGMAERFAQKLQENPSFGRGGDRGGYRRREPFFMEDYL